MAEFYQTKMGRKLIEGDIPRITKALERIADDFDGNLQRIADALIRIADALEKQSESDISKSLHKVSDAASSSRLRYELVNTALNEDYTISGGHVHPNSDASVFIEEQLLKHGKCDWRKSESGAIRVTDEKGKHHYFSPLGKKICSDYTLGEDG